MTIQKKRGRKLITDTDILKDLQRVAKLLKQECVGINPYKKHGLYSVETIPRHFGTWNEAVKKAKLKPHRWNTEKELLDDLKKVAKEIKPTKLNSTIYGLKGKYSVNTYTYRFGGWFAAMKKAGLE